MELCKLCKIREATQKNSHIFPKFMGISMLVNKGGLRRGYKITSFNGLFQRPYQDTPKEDNVFCPICESLINERFEQPIFKSFYQNRESPRAYFNLIYRNYYSCRVYYQIDYQLFIKFIYSIVFRAAITRIEYFREFHLSKEVVEKLRRILLNEIPFESLPILILTCPNNPNPSGNFIGALSSDKNVHLLGVNEYIIFIDLSDRNYFENMFPKLFTPSYELVRIVTLPYSNWNSLIMGPVFGPVIDTMHKRLGIKFIIDGLFIHKWISEGFPFQEVIMNKTSTVY